MKTIFELVQAQEIASFWETFIIDRPPFLGEILFPNQQKLGLDLKWIKGSAGLPVVLKPSAFDVAAVPRPRIGFDRLTAEMPFFKESTYIDEELRQELNKVLESGNQLMIDAILGRIFNDEMRLLEAAQSRREMMRMSMLTTGAISISANGQNYEYDYGIPANHKVTVEVSWSDPEADIVSDISNWQDIIEADTGIRPTRAIFGRKIMAQLKRNKVISKAIYVMANGEVMVSENKLRDYLMDELGIELIPYTKKYINDNGAPTDYVPENTFVLCPAIQLGNTWFGTTPEQSDLMTSQVANVSIVETGVAITTIQKADPVNVETKVTMITLPSFEAADSVLIADTQAPTTQGD